jgi:hypothetical protein
MLTVLGPEGRYPDTGPEREVLGPGVRVLQGFRLPTFRLSSCP